MKKGDLTMKAIGLAIAGVFAGSRLTLAAPKDDGKSGAKNRRPATRRAPRTRPARLRQARLQGHELLQGQGRLQERRQRLLGQELLQGQGRLRLGRHESLLQGHELLQGPGRLQERRQRLRGQELLQGQGRLRRSGHPQGGLSFERIVFTAGVADAGPRGSFSKPKT